MVLREETRANVRSIGLETTVTRKDVGTAHRFTRLSLFTPLIGMFGAVAVAVASGGVGAAPVLAAWAMLIAFLLCPVFAIGSYLTALPTATKASVVVSQGGIEIVTRKNVQRIDRWQITGVLSVPTLESGVELFLANGNVIRLDVANKKTAQDIVERLGFGPGKHRVELRLASPQKQLAGGCATLPLGLFAGWVLAMLVGTAGLSAAGTAIISALIIAFVSTAATFFVFRSFRPDQVVIGADGFTVDRAFDNTYYPFSQSTEVTSEAGELRMQHMTIARGDRDLVRAAAKYINASSEAGPEDPSHEAISNIVDKGNRSVEEWKAALVASNNESGYRNTAITPDALRAVVEDPYEDEIRRLGAAMLLRIAHPDDIPRIRIAADACANEDLRAALEAAAEDEVNEAVVKRITTR